MKPDPLTLTLSCLFGQFLSEDSPLFQGIISDLFPGVVLEQSDYGPLLEILKKTLSAMKLEYTDLYIERIIQVNQAGSKRPIQ